MGPTWVRQDPGGPHVGPMNLAIWGAFMPVDINPCCAKFKHFWKCGNVFVFCIISWSWEGVGSWNPSSWNTKIHLSYIVNAMTTDDLVMQGVRATAKMMTFLYCKYQYNVSDPAAVLARIYHCCSPMWHHISVGCLFMFVLLPDAAQQLTNETQLL